MEAAYRELTPDDPVAAYGWLFDGYPDLPEGNAYQATEDDNSIEVARQSAIREAYEIGGVSAVLAIAETATRPVAVGKAFADTFETEPALTLALEHLESDNRNRREMVCSILWELYQRLRWPVLDNTIAHLKATNGGPKAVASVYLVPLPEYATWERLSAEAQDVQRCYWAETNPWHVPEAEETSQFVAEQLLAVRRSATVAQWVAHLPIDYEIVIRTLEQLPIDLTTESPPAWDWGVITYCIVKLLEKLDESDPVGDDLIARLEVPFIAILGHGGRPDLAIYREIAKEPSLLADLIASGYRREDALADAMPEAQPSEVTKELLAQIITGSGDIPGKLPDGTVDEKALSIWVNEARRLCGERGRGVIGDIYIGNLLTKAPLGADGIWPCEPVRELLDTIHSPNIGRGFVTGTINQRGITSRGLFEGGNQERALADNYLNETAAIRSNWPFTASLLTDIAESYELAAKQYDLEADELDQFES